MPIVYCVVNSEDQSLMDILDIVEKLARELAFNLEVVKFSEALIHLNICANDVLHYYEILSFYFDRAFNLNLSSELIIRIETYSLIIVMFGWISSLKNCIRNFLNVYGT